MLFSLLSEFLLFHSAVASISRDKYEILPYLPGPETPKHAYPFMVYMRITYLYDWYRYSATCDGTLINDTAVLTAAHCVVIWEKVKKSKRFKDKTFDVYFGMHNIPGSFLRAKRGYHFGSDYTEKIIVKESNRHLHYRQGGNGFQFNDVGILELRHAPKLIDGRVEKLFVETWSSVLHDDDMDNSTCHIAGWGLRGYNQDSPKSNVLRHLPVPFKSLSYVYKKMGIRVAGVPVGMGDSGGPLFCRNKAKTVWKQYGIVSSVDTSGAASYHMHTFFFYKYIRYVLYQIGHGKMRFPTMDIESTMEALADSVVVTSGPDRDVETPGWSAPHRRVNWRDFV